VVVIQYIKNSVGFVPVNPNVPIIALQVGGEDVYAIDGKEVVRINTMDISSRRFPWLRPTALLKRSNE